MNGTMKLPLLVAVMALAIAAAPALVGQVNVGVGIFEGGGHDLSASVNAVKDVDLGFRHKQSKGGRWMQDLALSAPLSDRLNLGVGWHRHNLGTGRADGVVASLNGNCKGPAGFGVSYGVRGYPSVGGRVASRGAGWSAGLQKELGSTFGVHVGWDWDRFWANRGPNSVKMAGVYAGVSFRLGGS